MGRYSAPHLHHDYDVDDIGDEMDIDWVASPDSDDEHCNIQTAGGFNGDGDSNNHNGHTQGLLTRYKPTPPGATAQSNCSDDGCTSNFVGSVNSRHFTDNGDDNTNDNRANNAINDNHDALLRVAEQYVEQSNRYSDHQYMSERRRRRMRNAIIVVVAIIGIVLKRHAPPPPPLWGQSHPSIDVPYADKSGDTTLRKSGKYVYDSIPSASTQHETWGSYSRHILQLVHHSFSYGLSVVWYATSNAFVYTFEEVRDKTVEYWNVGVSGWNHDEDVGKILKDKLLSIKSVISSMLTELQTVEEPAPNPLHPSQSTMADTQPIEENKIPACPIRLPAANNLHAQATNGIDALDRWSTEEFLRQTIGSPLSPQNVALEIISEGVDAWGESIVSEASKALVDQIATVSSASPKVAIPDDETLSRWILPPATGFLLVGSEGVGKLHTARRMAHLFLGHCSEASSGSRCKSSSMQDLGGVLEIVADDHENQQVHNTKKAIVDHIYSRRGLGSVIIIHHIELLETQLLSDITDILSKRTYALSHRSGDMVVEASCNGSVFILTSKEWGTKSVFRHLQQNGGVNGLDRASLVTSIRQEMQSIHQTDIASHTVIAPFFPFQQDDMATILQCRVQTLNLKFQGKYWSRLDLSYAVIKHAVGVNHVEYMDLDSEKESLDGEPELPLLTYSGNGAHTLDNHPFVGTLKKSFVDGTHQNRPGLTLRVELDSSSSEAVFSWCSRQPGGVDSCREDWRTLIFT